MEHEKYYEGIDMNTFPVIKEISVYNRNYHVGLDGDLLLGISDDDDLTEWSLVKHKNFLYLGESHTSENEKLHRFRKPVTI